MSEEGGLPGGEASRGGEVGGEEDGEEDGEDEEDKRQSGRECPNLVSWLLTVFWATSCACLCAGQWHCLPSAALKNH